ALTALARPPRLVSTFSLWRSAAEMRAFAATADGPHQAAVRADRARPFHHDSAFVRFRPYASRGSWGGRDPPAAVARAAAEIPLGEDLVGAGSSLEHLARFLGQLLGDQDFARAGGQEVGHVPSRGAPQHARYAVLGQQALDHFRLGLLLAVADLDQLAAAATRRQAPPRRSARHGSRSPSRRAPRRRPARRSGRRRPASRRG